MIGGKLVLITNRKSYTSFRLVPKSVSVNDLERRNGVTLRYFTEFGKPACVAENDLWRNLCKSLLYFYCVYNVVVKKVHVRYLIS